MKAKCIIIVYLITSICISLVAQSIPVSTGLTYTEQNQGSVPIPPSERLLETVVAKPYFKVTDEGHSLEGAIFDKQGNLLFCDVTARTVLKLTPDKRLSTVVTFETLNPGGLAFHPDGRLFLLLIWIIIPEVSSL